MITTVRPRFASERLDRPSLNTPCSAKLADRLLRAGYMFAHNSGAGATTRSRVIPEPRWIGAWRFRWLITSKPTLMELTLVHGHVRTYGVDSDGDMYVGREYPEFSDPEFKSLVFVSLHPLEQCTLDASVLEYELLPLLV